MSTEDILTQALAERAEATPYDATPLATVAGRARRIRRRRRTTGGAAAAAAVLAIVLPVAVVTGGDGTDAPAPAPAPDGPPSRGYAVDGVYHRADGSTVELPAGTAWSSVTELADGGLVVTAEDATSSAAELDADGHVAAQWCTSSLPVTSGSTAAWTEHPCSRPRQLTIVVDGPSGRVEHPVSSDPELTGVDDEGTVVYYDGAGARLLTADGTDRVIPGFTYPTDYDPARGRVSGQLEGSGGDEVVGGVTDLDGTVLWRRPGLVVGFFSPDGDRMVGRRASSTASVVVSASDGRVVTGLPSAPQAGGFVWQDGEVVAVAGPDGVPPEDVVWATAP